MILAYIGILVKVTLDIPMPPPLKMDEAPVNIQGNLTALHKG